MAAVKPTTAAARERFAFDIKKSLTKNIARQDLDPCVRNRNVAAPPMVPVRRGVIYRLPEERRIHVRAVNVGMAVRAGDGFRRARSHSVNRVGGDATVALVAERIDGRHVQQAGILGSVRRVAPEATLGPDRGVFVDERTANLGVALGADGVLVGRGPHIVGAEGAVRVMTIAALDQAFLHLVVKRHIERRLSLGVALEAEPRLRCLQQFVFRALVDAVAADATDVRLGVRRAVKVRVRSRVAALALGVNLFNRMLGGIEDLAYVAAAIHMRLPCAVAAFAGHAGSGSVPQRQLGMRVIFKSLGDFTVATGTGFRADKSCLIRLRFVLAGSCKSCNRQKQTERQGDCN